MIKKVYRPFWSYDVVATEQWLMKMAASGFSFKSINFLTKVFIFEKSELQNINYKILFDKSQNRLTEKLISSDWQICSENKKWVILENTSDNIIYSPQRFNLIEHAEKTSKILCVILAILGAYLLFDLIMYLTIAILVVTHNGAIEYVPAPYPILDYVKYITPLIPLLIVLWLIIAIVKTKRSIKKLEAECNLGEQLKVFRKNSSIMGNSIDESDLIKVRKLFGLCDYDKLVAWLEAQAQNGFILKKVKQNIFYFKKDLPQNIKYFIDTQKYLNPSYYEINKQVGFDLIYETKINLNLSKIIIWSKNLEEDDPIKQLYSDKRERLLCAKKLMINTVTIPLVFIMMGLLYVFMSIKFIFITKSNTGYWLSLGLIWLLAITLHLFTVVISIKGYLKTRKKIKTKDTV